MKRAIALFLAVLFVVTLIPASALAAGEELTLSLTDCVSSSGSAPIHVGESFTVTANEPAEGKVFEGFELALGTPPVAVISKGTLDATTRSQTFTVDSLASSINVAGVKAVYSAQEIRPAAGVAVSPAVATEGTPVTVLYPVAEGEKLEGFKIWSSVSGNVAPTTENLEAGTASFVMPKGHVNVTPIISYKVTIKAGSHEVSKFLKPEEVWDFTLDDYADTMVTAVPDTTAPQFAESGSLIGGKYTMPASATAQKTLNATAEALYEVTAPSDCTVEVISGTKKGNFAAEAATVKVKSDLDPSETQVASWVPNSITADTNNNSGSFTMPAASVTVEYGTLKYKINAGTNVTSTPADFAEAGATVTLDANVPANETFEGWTLEGATMSETEAEKKTGAAFTMPANPVTASFTSRLILTLTAATTNGPAPAITAEGHPVSEAITGDVVNLKAQEEVVDGGETYYFKNWTVDETSSVVEDEDSAETTMTVGSGNTTVTANYAKGAKVRVTGFYTEYDKNNNPVYKALVQANLERTYAADKKATITAVNINGYQFVGWYEDNGNLEKYDDGTDTLCGTDKTLAVTMGAAGSTTYRIAMYKKAYKLNVENVPGSKVFVNGVAQDKTEVIVPMGATVSVYPEITGVRSFSHWNASGIDTSSDAYKRYEGVAAENYKFEFTMPSRNVKVQAVYSVDETLFTEGKSWLEVRPVGSPKALSESNAVFYAYGDKLAREDFDIIFYPNGDEGSSVVIDPSDVILYLYKHGTTTQIAKTTAASNAELKTVGSFDLKAEYWVGGKKIATSLKTYPSCINVLTAKPEYILMDSAPASYYDGLYRGDAIDMSGASVYLGALVNGVYVKVTELKMGEYEVWPQYNPGSGAYEYEYGDSAEKGGKVKIVLGYTDTVQNLPMTWVIPYGGIDEVELLASAGAATITYTTDTVYDATIEPNGDYSVVSKAKVAPDSKNVFVNYGVAGDRKITISGVDNAEQIRQVKSTDTSVARIERDTDDASGFTYKITPVASGEATIIVDLKGAGEDATMLLTVVSNGDENTEKVTSFKLSPATMNLYVGSKAALTPTAFNPGNANQLIARWEAVYKDTETDASYCISVDDNGTVSVNNYTDRKVIIRAYPKFANDPTYCATCEVTVKEVPVTNLAITETELTLYNKATKALEVTVQPEGATNKNLVYASSDSGIVAVDLDGNMTAMKIGTATVTISSESNPSVKKTIKVTVVASVLATSLQLNKTSLTLGYNETATLTAYVEPANVTTKKAVWSSDDESIVEVDANGRVTSGEKTGTAMITATMNDGSGLTATCLVTVSKVNSSAVTLNKVGVSLFETETEQITATVYPSNASNRTVTWSSSNPKVAKVDSTGRITGVGVGGAIITATAADGSGKYADCVVVVNQKIAVKAITLNMNDFVLLLNDTTTLTAAVTPANATYDKITWTTSNASIASVDEKGKVSGRAVGQAIITASIGDVSKSITVTVSTKLYSNGTVVNCKRRVNVREKASGTSKFVGYAYLGDTYKVLGMSGTNWYLIQYNATTTAYIWAKYLSTSAGTKTYTSSGAATSTATTTTTTTTTTTPATKTLSIINCENCVNVRSGPGTTFSKLGYAYLGTTYTYTALKDGFYEVDFSGVKAYISQNYCQTNG